MSKIAIVSRDAPGPLDAGRFRDVAEALAAEGLAPVACVYDESGIDQLERDLAGCVAALVWVNPVQDGRNRRGLDELLRRAASRGLMVSAHPEVIDRMGVKAVVALTRELGWGSDAHFYSQPSGLAQQLPMRLRAGPRVLKRNRGNGGVGVWKLERLGDERVRVLAAAGSRVPVETRLQDFMADRLAEFGAADGYIDQAFQPRAHEGMIRCYMSGAELVGFGWQKVRALVDSAPTPPRSYSDATDPRFQRLRSLMERDWTPGLKRILGLGDDELPAIWDADFLLGPAGAAGNDTYVLCEINASSVHPMPADAAPRIARTLAQRLSRLRS
jgi:hypothetical protein